MTVRRIRQSEIRKWKACRRSWNYSYRQGWAFEPDEPTTADVGTIVHAALEAYYRDGTDPAAHVRAAKLECATKLVPLTKKWSDSYDLAEIMVEGYIEWLAETGADADYKVLDVERRLEVPFGEILGDEIILTGMLDLVVEHEPTGLIYLRDHKTVQSLEQAGRQLQVDDQLLTYVLLKRLLDGTKVAGAEHNMLKRVKRTATATPPFYERVQVTFNDTQLKNHWRHLHAALTEMVGAYQALEADPDAEHTLCYPSPGKDCGWSCGAPGIALCAMIDDGSDWQGFLESNMVRVGHSPQEAA